MAKAANNNKQNFAHLDAKSRAGFTIIEVVLVLAIAGLIFLIVFLALPGLQKSRRDAQRKSDANRMIAAIISYQSNTGSLPVPNWGKPFAAPSCSLGGCVLQTPDKFNDPSTGTVYNQIAAADSLPEIGDVVYAQGYRCNGTTGASWGGYTTTNSGTAIILMPLEAGGYYCQDTGA